jgi:hypothetical protein
MSNSNRKNPIMGNTTCESEKHDKHLANKKYRRLVKVAIIAEKANLPLIREVSDHWHFGKEGKQYAYAPAPKWMRK